MTARLPLKLGSSDARGDDVTHWGKWFAAKYKSYAAPVDGYYGNDEANATRELQRRLGVPVTGIFDAVTAAKAGYKAGAGSGTPAPASNRRPIWLYSAPGSGADWWVGPSFEVGKWAQDVLKINHQPVGFPKGGYLGMLGGDPGLSYIEVITAQKNELRRLIEACPDLTDPAVEFWFSGYSQSGDGMVRAVNELFGDGGQFAHLRSRINGLILFGNPARQRGSGRAGHNPAGYGIARDVYPKWLNDITFDITTTGDFYACVPDNDEIRPAFYDIIIQAEMALPFFVHVLKIALPVIVGFMPIFGGLLGPFAPIAIAGFAGIQGFVPLLGGLMGQAQSAADEEVDRKLIEMLTITGLIKNLPALLGLVGALPGLQAHGEYHLSKPEFGGRTGIQVGCDVMANFRR